MIKHQAEDWIYQPSWSYQFIEPSHWEQNYTRKESWKELAKIGDVPRFSAMYDAEEATAAIQKVIEQYRVK